MEKTFEVLEKLKELCSKYAALTAQDKKQDHPCTEREQLLLDMEKATNLLLLHQDTPGVLEVILKTAIEIKATYRLAATTNCANRLINFCRLSLRSLTAA